MVLELSLLRPSVDARRTMTDNDKPPLPELFGWPKISRSDPTFVFEGKPEGLGAKTASGCACVTLRV